MSASTSPAFIFNMGDRVRDVVSGYEGIVIARFEYWTGCNHYGVEAAAKDTGKVPYEAIDEQRLELVESGAVALVREYRSSPDAAPPRQPFRST